MSKSTRIASVQSIIKKQLQLSQTDAIFLFTYHTLTHFNQTIGELAVKFSDQIKNAPLVIEYTEYSVFGAN